MSDHEFERQVQQKMDELRFTPSADVWKGVAMELDKDHKRRWGLLWWPAALLVLLAGGGYLYLKQDSMHAQDGRGLATKKAVEPVKEKEVTPAGSEQASSTIAEFPTSNTPASSSNDLSKQATSASSIAQQPTSLKQGRDIRTGMTINSNSSQPLSTGNEVAVTDFSTSNAVATTVQRDPLATLFPSLVPGANPFVPGAVATGKQSQVPTLNNTAIAKTPATKQSRWSYGLTAGVNRSGMNEGGAFNFKRASVVDLSGGMQNSSMLPVNTVIYKPSEIKPGIGFTLGGYAQRSLNKRFDLSFGLGFTRFSNSIMVGELMNTPIAVNAGPSSTARMVNPYYTRGGENEYKTHMDFVEVPVNIAYKFNPSSKVPISVNAGVVGGKLVGSNALHFDGSSAGYFKNNELLKKWQLGVNAGIATTMMNKSKHPVTVGPSFRYQLTNSLSNEVGAKRNIMSVGVDAKVKLGVFGKK